MVKQHGCRSVKGGLGVGRPEGGASIGAADKAAFVELIRKYGFKETCAERLGQTRQGFDYHLEKDPEFNAAFLVARAEYEMELLDKVDDAKWALQHLRPKVFTDRQKIEHEGGVQVILTPHPDMLDDEQGGSDE